MRVHIFISVIGSWEINSIKNTNLLINGNGGRGNACFILISLFVFSFSQGKDGIHGVPGKPGLKASPR